MACTAAWSDFSSPSCHTAPGLSLDFGPNFACVAPSGVCSPPGRKGAKATANWGTPTHSGCSGVRRPQLGCTPVPHKRHLPVAAFAHDTQVAVGGQGHDPGADPQSGCGGRGGRGGERRRETPLMPERMWYPRPPRRPCPGARAEARPTATPLP